MNQTRVDNSLFVTLDEPVMLEPATWCVLYNVEILDPDGWRGHNFKPWTNLITIEEFIERFDQSTVRGDGLDVVREEVRVKNKPLNSSRSTIHNQGEIMADQSPQPSTPEKVKVSLRQRARNFMTKHPRAPKVVALVAAVLTGVVGHKVVSERRVVHKETLASLEAEAYTNQSTPETYPVTEA